MEEYIMANLRYGMKEVANVVFFDLNTKKPAILFDTLKVSTIENEAENAKATGGQGANSLISWDYGRTATLTLQDALLSDTSLAMLAGNAVNETNVTVVNREVITLTNATAPIKVTLKEKPTALATVSVYKMDKGIMTTEITGNTLGTTGAEKELTLGTATPALKVGDKIMVFYEYVATGATQVTFSGNAFPSTYRVVGDTVVRGEDGVDRKMQFVIPKAKLQSSFSLPMDTENVATFDFNLEVLIESETQKLFDIIRLA